MKIALASDHAGYEQLKELETQLRSYGYDCQNFGPHKLDPADDYPDFILPAARAVASGDCEAGIVIGRSGQGEAMAANRVRGARCAVFYGPAVAKGIVDQNGQVSHDPYEILKKSREHNDANMLSLASSYLSLEEMKRAIKVWLETSFSNADRHERRIKKLDRET